MRPDFCATVDHTEGKNKTEHKEILHLRTQLHKRLKDTKCLCLIFSKCIEYVNHLKNDKFTNETIWTFLLFIIKI